MGSFVIKNTGGGGFAAHPAGVFPSRCVRIVDLGTQKEEFQGKPKEVRKIVFFFETSELMTEGEYAGKPMLVNKEYSAFLNDKANLRKDLEAWRGRAFTPAEMEQFDIANVLGKPLFLNISAYTKKNGEASTKIAGLMPLPAGMSANPAAQEPFFFTFFGDDGETYKPFDKVSYEKLSEFWQKKIAQSPEYLIATGQKKPEVATPKQPGDHGFNDMDDDIPF